MTLSSPALFGRRALQSGPTPASPAKRHAQHELTQKLLAMDVALERIERCNGPMGAKENCDPMAVEQSFEMGDYGFEAADTYDVSRALPAPSTAVPHRYGGGSPHRSSAAPVAAAASMLRDSSPPSGLGLATLEAAWREAHAALRTEVARELTALREALRRGEEEQQRSSVRLLTEFEVELTSALEARAKESDVLLERKLVEAGDGLQKQFTAFDSERKKLAGLEGESQRRIDSLDAAVVDIRQSCSEALRVQRDQLATFSHRIQHVQDDALDTKEQLAALRQAESGGAARQLSLEAQLRDVLRERERRPEAPRDTAALADLHAERVEARLEEVRRGCDLEVAALRGRLEAVELRGLDDVHALRAQLEEANESSVWEASIAAQVDRLGAELFERQDHFGASNSGEVDRQLARADEDRNMLSGQLNALADRQQRQQKLIEDLLATARRPGSNFEAFGSSGSGAMPAELGERLAARLDALDARLGARLDTLSGRIDTLGARSATLEESCRVLGTRDAGGGQSGPCVNAAAAANLAERCIADVEMLAARVAATESRANEASEALQAWPRRVESLSSRLHGGRDASRAAEEQAAQHSVQLKELSAVTERIELAHAAHVARLAEHGDRVAAAEETAARAWRVAEAAERALSASEQASAEDRGGISRGAESHGAMVRLEARVELAEARQRVSVQEIRSRLDALGKRSSENAFWDGCEPWVPQLRQLERDLKSLMAEQVEDSAQALRSVASMVEESIVSSKCGEDASMLRRTVPPTPMGTPLRPGYTGTWRPERP